MLDRITSCAVAFLVGVFCSVAVPASAELTLPLDAVSKWKAEDDATDSVGDNDGTLVNDAGFADGIVGKAFQFDGIDQSVTIPSNASLRPGDGSFSGAVWFRHDSPPAVHDDQVAPLMAMVDGDYDNGWSIVAGGTPYSPSPACGVDDITHTISQAVGVPIPVGTFALLTCVYDAVGDSLSLYVNGALQATAVAVEGPVNPSSDLWLARYDREALSREEFFHGLIDEAQYFARVLSDEEVASVFMDVIPLTMGDIDCSGEVTSTDALKTLRHSVQLPIAQTQPCPRPADLLAGIPWGDIDCTEDITATDALKVLRHAVQLDVVQTEPCADPGQSPL